MMEYLLVLLEAYLLRISPRASFGCDSGFFGLAALVLCLVFFLKKPTIFTSGATNDRNL